MTTATTRATTAMDARVGAAPWIKASGSAGSAPESAPGKRSRLDPADPTLSTTIGPMEIVTFFVTLA